MNARTKFLKALSFLAVCATAPLLAAADGSAPAAVPAPKAPAIDPDLPQPFDPNAAQSMLENSPFTRALNLSDSLVLTGIAYIKGKPIATIMNKTTKESYVVSEEPNANGWKLAQTTATASLNKAQAKVMIGSEIVTVRYSDDAMTADTLKKGGFKPGGGDAQDSNHGGNEDRPQRKFNRPTPEDMQRFQNLSNEAKGKFISVMMQSRERLANASDEERNSFRQSIFNKIEKEDGKGSSK